MQRIFQPYIYLCFILGALFVQTGNAALAMNHSDSLRSQLSAALKVKGKDYKPRTRHLQNGQPLYTNRLIFEDSPYLLQHAHNPVDWYPWSEEAFAEARRTNKPIFLSIGYATCHWCHVMEEESFEDPAIAKILNKDFIAIKVDREQYPDIDQTYMTAVTLLTGHGGWPMSSFLTSEGKPFFAGTYYPSATFTDLLLKIDDAWTHQRLSLIQQADKVAEAVQQATSAQADISTLEESVVKTAVDSLIANYDSVNGGFGQAPKFPNEPLLLLLFQSQQRHPDPQLLKVLQHTLSTMAQGGIYDQLGGGFHRYATDAQWRIPHFEKMLYNQAYLARVYTQAFQLTGNPLYARIVRQTLDYVLREMTTSSGLFYSATDADSDGREGCYFIWSEDELKALLSTEDAHFISTLFGITRHGNFEGKNILYLPIALDTFAQQQQIPLGQLLSRLDPLLVKLRKQREQRNPPLTDNKSIVAWNAMLITALAEAGEMLVDPRYIEAAEKAADTLWQQQRTGKGSLWRVNLNGKTSIPARQDDYVHFSEALIALYDIDANPIRLQQARELCDEMLDKFQNDVSGTLNMGQDTLLFAQPQEAYDGALPSGNAMAVRVLSRLSKRTGDSSYTQSAANILRAFSGNINDQPAGYSYMLAQLDEFTNGEISARQYASGGAVKVNASLNTEGHLLINLDIARGWHINAHQPFQKDLVATEINLQSDADWQLESVSYPKATESNTKFKNTPLALYQGNVKIRARLNKKNLPDRIPLALKLRLQACNLEACLPPETVHLLVFEPLIDTPLKH